MDMKAKIQCKRDVEFIMDYYRIPKDRIFIFKAFGRNKGFKYDIKRIKN